MNSRHSLAQAGFATRAAVALSYVVNPFVVPPLLAWILMAMEAAPTEDILGVVAVVFVLLSAVPASFLTWRVHTGRVRSFEVADPDERLRIALVAFGGALALLPILAVVAETTPRTLQAVLFAYMLDMAILMAITRFWKISLHTATVGGFFGVFLFVTQHWPAYAIAALVVGSLALTAGVGWARLHLKAHSVAQVILGSLFGLVVPFAQLQAARAVGWL